MVRVVHRGVDQVGHAGPGVVVAGAGLTAKDVPQTSHKVSADRDEHGELYDTE